MFKIYTITDAKLILMFHINNLFFHSLIIGSPWPCLRYSIMIKQNVIMLDFFLENKA